MTGLLVSAAPATAVVGDKAGSGWAIRDNGEACSASRLVKSGKTSVAFSFERYGLYGSMELVITGSGLRPFRKARQVDLKLGQDSPVQRAPMFVMRTPADNKALWIFFKWPKAPEHESHRQAVEQADPDSRPTTRADERASAAHIDRLDLSYGVRPATFEFGSLSQPIAGLHECMEKHLAAWNLDTIAHRSLSQVTLPENENSLIEAIYRDGQKGRTRFGTVRLRVMVDAAGKATSCKAVDARGDAGLGFDVCKAVMRSPFRPALTGTGTAIDSVWITTLSFAR